MPFKFREVRKTLKKKGFVEDKKGHHIYLHHYHNGRKTGPYTRLSHGKDSVDIGDDIVRAMRSQLGLSDNRQVRGLVDCSVTSEEYVKLLQEAGIIPSP